MAEAEVRMQDGQPCFTISAKEAASGGTVLVQAVPVSDPSSKPVKDLWWVMFDPARRR